MEPWPSLEVQWVLLGKLTIVVLWVFPAPLFSCYWNELEVNLGLTGHFHVFNVVFISRFSRCF